MLYSIKKIIPKKLFQALQPKYHYTLALLGAFLYRFPSKKIKVVGVTGTKGKSSTVELLNSILEEAGYKTAVAGTIRFKVDDESKPNRFKMTMPGRFFMQRFLHRAVKAGCQYAILEMTSEGAKQFRHKWIYLDALIFTNIAPEHIESHGSYENYVKAKLQIAKSLEESPKENKVIIANIDDKHANEFLNISVEKKYTYTLKNAFPYTVTKEGIDMTYKKEKIHSPLLGVFTIYNILAAISFAESQNIALSTIKSALSKHEMLEGRVEKITLPKNNPISDAQDFTVIVDYAHTKESLEQLYQTFENERKICVLGNTGGGRDKWKRPEMGAVADRYCARIILTNEDPYDEDPKAIVEDMEQAMQKHTPEIIMDRRAAIRKAFSLARKNDVVLITGKGTDPYIMEKANKKTPWSDVGVARDELEHILQIRKDGNNK